MRVVFFYPSHRVGGAEYLIIRLTEYFLEHNINCYIIDFKNGIYRKLSKKIPESAFIEFKENFIIPEDSYIVTYPSEIKKLSEYINKNNKKNKVLFWIIHHDNFESLIPLKNHLPNFLLKLLLYPTIKKTIRILNEKKSLIAMNSGVLERFKYLYGVNYDIPYCPIPVKIINKLSTKNTNYSFTFKSKNKFKCVWLGRISVEKIYPIKRIIEDMDLLNNVNIEFDIIGDGEYKYIIKEFKPRSHLKVRFLGTIIENLDSILKNYDICFAMGTSALEAAKLGIPTVLVDPSYCELPRGYKYRWLYETEDFNLGYMLPTEKVKENKLNIGDIFNILSDQEKKIIIGERCYQYVVNNHSLETVAKKLLDFINNSKLTIEDVRELEINSSLFFNLFKKIHKIGKKIKRSTEMRII
jgi:glycosyltransferase involved in cell wall biosynthesis